MPGVEAALRGVFAIGVQQVAKIVEQRSGHQRVGRRRFSGSCGRLQAMFEHRYGFAEVGCPAAGCEHGKHLVYG